MNVEIDVDKIDLMTESNRNVFQSELKAYNKITHPFPYSIPNYPATWQAHPFVL